MYLTWMYPKGRVYLKKISNNIYQYNSEIDNRQLVLLIHEYNTFDAHVIQQNKELVLHVEDLSGNNLNKHLAKLVYYFKNTDKSITWKMLCNIINLQFIDLVVYITNEQDTSVQRKVINYSNVKDNVFNLI